MGSLRRLAAVGLVVAPAALVGGPAHASESASFSLAVDRSAWSWRSAAPAGLPVREPSLVPNGRLAVASDGSPEPAKATYLRLELPELPPQAVVDALTLSLPVDPAAEQVDPGGIRLVACRLLAEFAPGEAVEPAGMPDADCSTPAEGEYDAAAGAWSFAVTDLARAWVTGAGANHGLVVRPALDYAAPTDLPFQLVFASPAEIRAQLTATLASPPAVTGAPTQPGQHEAGPPPGFTSLPPLDSGMTALPPLVSGPAPQAPVTAPDVAAPVSAAGAPVSAPLRPATTLAQARTTPGAVLSLGALVALMLLAVSRVLGDTSGPLAFARAERSRLDRIRLRAPLGAVAAPAAPVVALPAQVPQRRQGRRPIASAASTVT